MEFVDHIRSVHIVYDMRPVRDLLDRIRKQAIRMDSCIRHLSTEIVTPVQQYNEEKHKLLTMLESLEDLYNRFQSEPAFRKTLSTEVSFVVFDNEKTRNKFLR